MPQFLEKPLAVWKSRRCQNVLRRLRVLCSILSRYAINNACDLKMSTYDVRTCRTVFFHDPRGDFIDRRCMDAWFSLTCITVEIYSGRHASIKLVTKMVQGIQHNTMTD